jgi:hypothetical protein
MTVKVHWLFQWLFRVQSMSDKTGIVMYMKCNMSHFKANILFFQNLLRMLAALYGVELDDRVTAGFTENFEIIRQLIADYGDCLSFDYFKPVKDEREAEKIALSETGFAPTASEYC